MDSSCTPTTPLHRPRFGAEGSGAIRQPQRRGFTGPVLVLRPVLRLDAIPRRPVRRYGFATNVSHRFVLRPSRELVDDPRRCRRPPAAALDVCREPQRPVRSGTPPLNHAGRTPGRRDERDHQRSSRPVVVRQSFTGDCQTGGALRSDQVIGQSFCGHAQMEAMGQVNNLIPRLAPVINTQSYDWRTTGASKTGWTRC